MAAIENGTYPTRGPSRLPFKTVRLPGLGPFGEGARRQRSRDRAASRRRKRMMGGSGRMPHSIRHHYTEGERAVLSVVACEVKRHGLCDLPVGKIAAIAGVCERTVQYALKAASSLELAHVMIERRPRPGKKNLTNVIRIVSREWLAWLRYEPDQPAGIGCKTVRPSKNHDNYKRRDGGKRDNLEMTAPGRSEAKGPGMRERRQGRASPRQGGENHAYP